MSSNVTDCVLDQEELIRVRRMQKVLNDTGFRALLIMVAIEDGETDGGSNNGTIIAEALSNAMNECTDPVREDCADVGPSFCMVVTAINALLCDDELNVLAVPSDCVPTMETAEKCWNAYWDLVRSDGI